MHVCLKCSAETSINQLFNCDNCKRSICQECLQLTATEICCIQLKARNLIFLCEECKQGLGCVPQLLQEIANLKEEIAKLKIIKPDVECQENLKAVTNNDEKEDIINEILDRSKSKKNIMISNITESQKTLKQDRQNEN